MEEPDGTSHAVLVGGLGPAQGCQGPPANGLARPAAGPLPAPLLRRLASARPSGRDEQGYSPDETECQEQSENITHTLPLSLPVMAGLVPGIPIAKAQRLTGSGWPARA